MIAITTKPQTLSQVPLAPQEVGNPLEFISKKRTEYYQGQYSEVQLWYWGLKALEQGPMEERLTKLEVTLGPGPRPSPLRSFFVSS